MILQQKITKIKYIILFIRKARDIYLQKLLNCKKCLFLFSRNKCFVFFGKSYPYDKCVYIYI